MHQYEAMITKKSRIGRKNISGNEAQGMVEFAIVFPILFLFFLAICQTAMLYTAREVVQYAAFAAVRSAVVWIPEEKDIDVLLLNRIINFSSVMEIVEPVKVIVSSTDQR